MHQSHVQALKALPLVVGTLPSTGSFWIQVIAVDNRLLDPAYFEKFLKKQLAAIDSGGLLWVSMCASSRILRRAVFVYDCTE